MPDAEELLAHEEWLRWAAAKRPMTADERTAFLKHMADRSWAEAERQRKSAMRRERKNAAQGNLPSVRECVALGVCTLCRREPVEVKANGDAYRRCGACRAQEAVKSKRLYQQRLADGVCPRCRIRAPQPGYSRCLECGERDRRRFNPGPRQRVRVTADTPIHLERQQASQDVWDAHRAAINMAINLANEQKDNPEMRRMARALRASGALLAEEVR